jgi:hypothetical protein
LFLAILIAVMTSLNVVADYIVDRIQSATSVDMIMGVSISVAIVLLSFTLWYIIESTKEEIIIESPSYKEKASISGSTPRYTWKQSDQDVDIFIPIEEYSKSSVVKSDIKIDIKASFITVSIAGETILNDDFFAAVIPDECNWQIEELEDKKRQLCINVYKRAPTSKGNHWKFILLADEKLNQSAADGVPIYDRSYEDSSNIDKKLAKTSK